MAHSTLRIGNVELMALIDCEVTAPTAVLFPPLTRESWEPYCQFLTDDCTNMQLTIPSFVVRSGGTTVLIDSGVGAKNRDLLPNGRLPDALAEAGVRPDEIDIVFATHIHIDHVGWHTTEKDGKFVPTFPNAVHVFARAEYDFFTAPAQRDNPAFPWVKDCVLPLEGAAKIELVDGEAKLTDELTLLPTPGHTPAHSAVAIMSGGETAVIIGDLCHHPAQIMETGWSPVFDMNPALAAESREKLVQRVETERWSVIGGHFVHPGFGRVVRVDGKRSWVPGL
jgi:glyoxylase-like metal-dependent hydrolase (beta-lactamase superfamily II)